MKQFIILFIICISLSSVNAQKQDSIYIKLMEHKINLLNDSKTIDDLELVNSDFIRIAEAQSEDWIPLYYASYSRFRIAMSTKLEGDYISSLDLLKKIKIDNDELKILKSRILFTMMGIDQYRYKDNLATAISLLIVVNENNPRGLLVNAIINIELPRSFGGNKKLGCEQIEKSIINFPTFILPSSIFPSWGNKLATGYSKVHCY